MWFDLLKFITEQEDATTVAELQRQVNALVEVLVENSKTDMLIFWLNILLLVVIVISLLWYVNSLEKRIKMLEAALSEKRAD